jgi:hypothetical protein
MLLHFGINGLSEAEILSDFSHYPVVQKYTSEELEKAQFGEWFCHGIASSAQDGVGTEGPQEVFPG